MVIQSVSGLIGANLAQRLENHFGAHLSRYSAGRALDRAWTELDGSIHRDSLPQMAYALALSRLDRAVTDEGSLLGGGVRASRPEADSQSPRW